MVISIIAVLMAILLPALARARSVARGVACSSNLSQMMRGWEVTVAEHKGKVDVGIVHAVTGRRPWWVRMEQAVDGLEHLRQPATGTRSFRCPEIRSAFGDRFLSGVLGGYTINAMRRPGRSLIEADSERFDWATLQSPATYPWFADPLLEDREAYVFAPRNYFGVASIQDWGLGFYHPQETGRAAFADGHVASNSAEDLDGPVDSLGTPRWLLDTR